MIARWRGRRGPAGGAGRAVWPAALPILLALFSLAAEMGKWLYTYTTMSQPELEAPAKEWPAEPLAATEGWERETSVDLQFQRGRGKQHVTA